MLQLRRWSLLAALPVLVVGGVCAWNSSPAQDSDKPDAAAPKLAEQFRKPIALAWVEPGRRLAAANRRSGSISLVDVDERRVEGETKVGERLADLARAGDSDFFAALDDETHEIVLLRIVATDIEIIGRLRVSDDPRRVVVAADGRTAVVSCRWSRRVDVVELRPEEGSRDPANWNRAFPRLLRSISLPFAPQELTFTTLGGRESDDGPLAVVVADAFGGRLALVDVERGALIGERVLEGRNMRGLTLADETATLLISFQRADTRSSTDANNVGSGKLVANLVARVELASLKASNKRGAVLDVGEGLERVDVDADGRLGPGAADPDDIVVVKEGNIAVLLSGTNQVLWFAPGTSARSRAAVGARPTALLLDPTTGRVITADSLDDTLSVVGSETTTIPLGPRPELWPRDRGERLFFDGRRSLGGFMSCHSCHTDGHTAGDLADTLGDGTYGTPKRIPTLLGTSITDPWGWNGALRELRDQVDQSMKNSMHDPHYRAGDADDVTAYLHTLKFPPPLIPKPRDEADERLVAHGRAIFAREGCAECHIGPLTFTSPAVYDVGPRDERGLAKFNPPSLRGVGHGVAFFHDARAKSLEELFRKERHRLDAELQPEELRALVRYLQGL